MRWCKLPSNCGAEVLVVYNNWVYEGLDAEQRGVKMLEWVFKSWKHPTIVVFSDNVSYKNGEILADAIRRYRLGRVVESDTVTNQNTLTSRIQAWVWTPDVPALAAWGEARGLSNRRWKKDYARFGKRKDRW